MGTHKTTKIALEFVEQVIDLEDDGAVCDLLLQHARRLGFAEMAVCELPFVGRPLKLVCTWPDEFRQHYLEFFYQSDPLARHARGTTEPFVWSQVNWDRSHGSPEQRVLDEAARVGLEDGFVVPVIGVDGDQSAVGLAGPRIRLDADDRRGLHLMSVFAHYAVSRRRAAVSEKLSSATLPPTEQEALKQFVFGDRCRSWETSRFSAREISEICHSARARFGARSLIEAGCIAFFRGEITP